MIKKYLILVENDLLEIILRKTRLYVGACMFHLVCSRDFQNVSYSGETYLHKNRSMDQDRMVSDWSKVGLRRFHYSSRSYALSAQKYNASFCFSLLEAFQPEVECGRKSVLKSLNRILG